MATLPSDLRDFIELLNVHDVRYVVVGGYAVAFHGSPRTTGDIGVFVEATGENGRRLVAALGAAGFASQGLTAEDFTAPRTIIQLGDPPNRVDILTSLGGPTFKEAWSSQVGGAVDGLPIRFIGEDALRANKAASGRVKAVADLDRLT